MERCRIQPPLVFPNMTHTTYFHVKDDRGHSHGEVSVVKWRLETIFWEISSNKCICVDKRVFINRRLVKKWFCRLLKTHVNPLCASGGCIRHYFLILFFPLQQSICVLFYSHNVSFCLVSRTDTITVTRTVVGTFSGTQKFARTRPHCVIVLDKTGGYQWL